MEFNSNVTYTIYELYFQTKDSSVALSLGNYLELVLDRILPHYLCLDRSHNRVMEYDYEKRRVVFRMEFTISNQEDVEVARKGLWYIMRYLCTGKDSGCNNYFNSLLSMPHLPPSSPPTCEVPNRRPSRPRVKKGWYVEVEEEEE